MKTTVSTFALAALLASAAAGALAFPASALAQSEDFMFDWSGQSDRHLNVKLMSGTVEVRGYDGDEVLVSAISSSADGVSSEPDEDGMRTLPNGGQNLVVRQDGGEVLVRAGSMDESARITVQVPRDARLSIHTGNDGAVSVEDVDGEMEIQNANGPVEVRGLRNAAVIHAHTDDLTVELATADLPGPLVLNSWAGDVELTVPAGLKAKLRWRTNMGDVRTNLDVQNIQTVTERMETEDGVRLEGFTTGILNGGGPEISITAYTGDITLRKAD